MCTESLDSNKEALSVSISQGLFSIYNGSMTRNEIYTNSILSHKARKNRTDISIARYIWLFYSIGTFVVIRPLGSQYKLQRIGILARKLKEILTAVIAFSFTVKQSI